MKYKLNLDENNYLTGFVHTGTIKDTYEMSPSIMELDFVNCYRLVDDVLFFDAEKKAEIIKAREEKENYEKSIDEQTLRLAQMFVEMGVNVDDFLDRLDAQILYTSLMTDTLLDEDVA